MKLDNEFEFIRNWAQKRGILQTGDVKTQVCKLQEEVGELASAVLENDREAVGDAIGDIVIVLTSLASLAERHFRNGCQSKHGLGNIVDSHAHWLECEDCGTFNIETCINKAFDVIKNRTGKMCNGTFKKD